MSKEMNGFRKLQERLGEEGWYVGWSEPCCQTCAWADLPDTVSNGDKIDFSKVLFNTEQDCESEEGGLSFDDLEAMTADEIDEAGQARQTATYTPEEQGYSMFCFDGSKKGVKNLTAILPIIEECGCSICWDGTGNVRPDISWEPDPPL